jgi:hypothetical protein
MFLFVLANFSMATFMDPGIFPRGKVSLLSWKLIVAFKNRKLLGHTQLILAL